MHGCIDMNLRPPTSLPADMLCTKPELNNHARRREAARDQATCLRSAVSAFVQTYVGAPEGSFSSRVKRERSDK